MSTDEQIAAEALEIMQRLDGERIETKAEIPASVLDVSGRDVAILFSIDALDRVGDVMSTKAFNRSIGLGVDRIANLYFHDDKQPCIGRIMKIETVGRPDLPPDVQRDYPDATGGGVATARMLTVGRGAEVYEGIQEGIPYGASPGFITKKAIPHPTVKRADGRPARWLQEVHLVEVSIAPPGAAINQGTRTRLNKALELLVEMKAGRRHSDADVSLLNEIAALVHALGATNIQLVETMLPLLPDLDQQAVVRPALTSDAKALIRDIGTILGGRT